MGTSARLKPDRLPEKLKRIREALGLSQDGILIRLKLQELGIDRSAISRYEIGLKEPALFVLLAYARAANVYLDVLADDNLDLPEHLPSAKTSLGKKVK